METSEEFTFPLLENYFKKYGFVSHQLETFNDFIQFGIKDVISRESELVFEQLKYSFELLNVHIPKAYILTNINQNKKYILPFEARLKDYTYETSIFCDIVEKRYSDAIKEPSIKIHRKVQIARIPVMVGSIACNTFSLTHEEKVKAGECDWDNGGYFILNGKEKVLVGQIRNAYNVPSLVKGKKLDNFLVAVNMRSSSTETGYSHLTTIKIDKKDKNILMSLTKLESESIDISIVLKALNVKDFTKYLSFDNSNKYVRDIKRKMDSITYEQALEKINIEMIRYDIFPHLGINSPIEIISFTILSLLDKLLMFREKQIPATDLENYSVKRVDMAGVLCKELFRSLYKKFMKHIKLEIEQKKSIPDIITIISKTDIITTELSASFRNSEWGVKRTSYLRTGVSQSLIRLSYASGISLLRRVMLPKNSRSVNSNKIRKLHCSHYGFICCNETPEGEGVGIALNLAMLCKVSIKRDALNIEDIIVGYFNDISKVYDERYYAIYINGKIIGFRDTNPTDELRQMRKKDLLPYDVSIVNDAKTVLICCDEGRFIRPLFAVKNNKVDALNFSPDWDILLDKKEIVYLDAAEIEQMVIAMYPCETLEYYCDYCEIHPSMMMGVMASMIPFSDCNQSPRNIYQASMGKQAIGLPICNYQHRTDSVLHVLDYFQKPLVKTSISTYTGFDDMPSGINAIVAIATYGGYNQEDSCIMNKASVDRGLFSSMCYKTHIFKENRKNTYEIEKIQMPPLSELNKSAKCRFRNYSYIGEDGIIKTKHNGKPIYVKKDDVILAKTIITSSKEGVIKEQRDDSYVIKDPGEEGRIDRVIKITLPNGLIMVKIVICSHRIPEMGDKYAARSAQKATNGIQLSQEDMPFTSQGITPDIIINPHCIPSRMTISQLLECVLGKACALKGEFGGATPFSKESNNAAEAICTKLENMGYDGMGWEDMYNGITGEKFEAKIFIGPTYYQRLKHMVKDKCHVRSTGQVNILFRQPTEGRSRDGGLRYGEMERDCAIAQGTSKFLNERLFEYSDKYSVPICDICGNISNNKKECDKCKMAIVSTCDMPYTTKLLLQYLRSIAIKTVFTTKT